MKQICSVKSPAVGLLILRVSVGLIFMWHGFPKMFGGVEKWEKLGGAMSLIGIDFFPTFFGFMAAFAEFFGGLMLVLGLFTPVAAALLAFTMLIATIRHGLADGLHPFLAMWVFVSLIFSGAGCYSIDAKCCKK